MSILKILSENLKRGARTRRPDDVVPYPAGYRGVPINNPTLCVGCKTCAYVCAPGAITFDESQPRFVVWQYFAEQCTFCGRCAEYCPCQALHLEAVAPPVSGNPARHRVAHEVPYRPCPRCGHSVMPVPAPVLARFFEPVQLEQGSALRLLCERCRNRVYSQRIKDAWRGQDDNRGPDQDWEELRPVRHLPAVAFGAAAARAVWESDPDGDGESDGPPAPAQEHGGAQHDPQEA